MNTTVCVNSVLIIKRVHFSSFCLFFARIYHGIPLPCPLYYLAQGDHNNMCCNHAITIITKTILYLFYYHWVLLISIFFGKELCKYKYKYSTSTVQGDKGFITNKISVSGTLPFVIIDELTEVFHRTAMDKCGKIRMTTVKIKKMN